jgi:hypothetical protein
MRGWVGAGVPGGDGRTDSWMMLYKKTDTTVFARN